MTVRQLKAARALLDWSQTDLARESGVSLPTIGRIEMVDGELGGRPETAEKLIKALERAGIEFIGDVGVKLDARRRRR
jgi:transcriptional regulator with XRE-family HTH domain